MALKTQEKTAAGGAEGRNGAPHEVAAAAADDTLESWKQIAAFLGRDERTVMRWEKEQGLPVRRIPGGKRGRVYASRSEVSRWLAGSPAQPEPTAQIVSPLPARSPKKYLMAVVVLFVLLALVLAGWFRLRVPRGEVPARVSFNLDSVEALDASGRVLWRHQYTGRIEPRDANGADFSGLASLARIVELWGTGERQVLIIAPLRSGPNPQDSPRAELDCFSSRGKLLWSYFPRETFKFGDRELNGPWNLYNVMVSSKPSHAIYLACTHWRWGNSFVVEIDPKTGRGTVRFVNTGSIHGLNELVTTRATYLLVTGFNNEFDGGSVAAIDETRTFAASPQSGGTRHKCVSCPAGIPDYYFVFPRSELNRVRQVYQNPVTSTDINGTEFEAAKRELDREDVQTFYLFDTEPILRPKSVRFCSMYDVIHRELETTGNLEHPFTSCPERLHPAPVRMWTPSEGWKELQVNSVE